MPRNQCRSQPWDRSPSAAKEIFASCRFQKVASSGPVILCRTLILTSHARKHIPGAFQYPPEIFNRQSHPHAQHDVNHRQNPEQTPGKKNPATATVITGSSRKRVETDVIFQSWKSFRCFLIVESFQLTDVPGPLRYHQCGFQSGTICSLLLERQYKPQHDRKGGNCVMR
jgi:hypothetical protein